MTYYDDLKKDKTYQNKISDEEKQFIKEIESSLNFSKFRYYQREALNIFDFFFNQTDDYYFKKQLKEGDIYYYGFEMATGSGKTYLIGANINYLRSKGIKNFLILTPNTTVYHKTIKNFDLNNTKCIFNGNLNFKYNLITGEDYTGRSNSYDSQIDTNIFVFNIQKFFDRITGDKTESGLKIKRAWEQGALRDNHGNSISLHDFLVNKELTIITDEAHHYQQKKSSDVIKDLKPIYVLEFTATAVEDGLWRRKQKIIYKYSINRYINDKFGKKIRALGHSTPELEKTNKEDLTPADKEKIILSLLIHQLKKKALGGQKSILLIRARNQTTHADKVAEFLKEELPYDDSLIEEIFNQVIIDEKYDIMHLIKEYIPTVNEFKQEIKKLKNKIITYHINSSSEENDAFENIETNDVEVVVQLKRAEEGWNVDTVYTILILNYNQSNIKTYVKQLIGRGLRLPKEKREDFKDPFKEQTEVLHVVCEKGNNFSQFIDQIKTELELSGDSIEEECKTEEFTNKTTLSDITKYNNLKLPQYVFESKLRFTATEILEQLTYKNLKLKEFVNSNTYIFKKGKILSFEEEEQNIELSMVKEDKTLIGKEREHQQTISLSLTESDFGTIIDHLIYSNPILPAVVATKQVLIKTLLELNKEDLKYRSRYEKTKDNPTKKKLLSKLYKYLSEQIDQMFTKETSLTDKSLKELFKEYLIIKKINPETNEVVNLLPKEKNVPKRDIKKYYFNNYKKSFYEYNWYESSHEKEFAKIIDFAPDVEFWIRNTRQFYLQHGMNKKYYPDFIIKTKEGLFIVEIKGTGYYEGSRENIAVLKDLSENKTVKIKGVLLMDTTVDKKLVGKLDQFSQILNVNDLS